MEKITKTIIYNVKLIPDERHRLSENQVDEALDLLEKELSDIFANSDFAKQEAFEHINVSLIELNMDEIILEFETEEQYVAEFDENIVAFMEDLESEVSSVDVCGLRTAYEYIPNCSVELKILGPKQDKKEELVEMINQEVTEYTITFNSNTELDKIYGGEYITEDKEEADELFDRIAQTNKLDQVHQYFAKTWVYSDDFGDYVEDWVDVYYTA